MANWARTDYVVEGSKADLQRIYDVIDGCNKGKIEPKNGSSDTWEGNIILSLSDSPLRKDEYLRGFIDDYWLSDDGTLRISAEEAWGETDFFKALMRVMPDVVVYFQTEELGCCVFETNDCDNKYFSDYCYVDYSTDDCCGIEYFGSQKEAFDFISVIFDRPIKSDEDLEQLQDSLNDNGNDNDYLHCILNEYIDC